MKGAFYCPYCNLANACDCDGCKPFIKEGEPVAIRNEDIIICAGCGKHFTYEQALDTEWELLKKEINEQTPGDQLRK